MIEMLFLVKCPDGREVWIEASNVSAIADEDPNVFDGACVFTKLGSMVYLRGVKARDVINAMSETLLRGAEELQKRLNRATSKDDLIDMLKDPTFGKVFQ